MLILPAIDLMDGQVVRLEQGRAERKTIYHDDPVAVARQWQDQGGQFLHLVDLDGAFHGELKNLGVVRAITEALEVPCELGGGLRSLKALEEVFAAGVARAIIGSKACESLDFIREAVKEFGGHRLAVGIDAKDGKVAIRGWVEVSTWDALDLARAVVDLGVGTVIYTDISTDGMLAGPNLAAQRAMRVAVPGAQLIASGGVSSLADIEALCAIDGLYGVIVGKALYDGKIDLPSCLSITR
jgi:phosphoribosylformimino-5-aminoimidazole carboxamide ribotide isomerase